MRGCLTLVLGLVIGLVIGTALSARPPAGITPPPGQSDVRVTISDTYLARQVAAQLAAISTARVQGLTISSAPPSTLVARAAVTVGPLSAPVVIGAQPVAEGGHLRVHLVSSQVAGLPVPGVFLDALQTALDRQTGNVLGGNARVTGTAVSTDGLVIMADYP